MPTNLPNQAQVTYSYGALTDTVLSNTTNTTLVDPYTLEVTKTAVTPSVTAGGDVVYVVRVENTGTGVLYNPTVTDDLATGTGTTAPLSYVDGSAKFYVNGEPSTGTATEGVNNVVFVSTATLQTGDNLIVVYAARKTDNQAEDIVNTASVSANAGSVDGTAVTGTDSETVTIETSANVTVFKAADKDTVAPGNTLTYTFTLMNTGNSAAESIQFVDAFPAEFTVNTVSYTVDGAETPIEAADYTITPPNTLTIPSTDTLSISVPAATAAGPGITIITVTGTVA